MPRCCKFKLIHNGYKIEFLDSEQQVESYIKEVLQEYKNLKPNKIFDRTFKGNKYTDGDNIRIIRYRYYTLYEEVFIIEY